MAGHGGPDLVQDGLVLSLDAASKNSYPGSGTTWSDLSGNGIDGTLSAAAIGTDVPGNMDFNGSDEYISFSSTDYGIATEWTVSWWMNMDDDGLQTFFSMKEAGGNNKIEIITNNNIREIFINNTDGGGQYNQCDTNNSAWSTSTWTHVAVTNNGGTDDGSSLGSVYAIYINGVSQSINSLGGSVVTPMAAVSRTLSIGKEDGGSRYVDGKITAVHVHNRALSAKEVSQNFNAQRSRFGV